MFGLWLHLYNTEISTVKARAFMVILVVFAQQLVPMEEKEGCRVCKRRGFELMGSPVATLYYLL